jgi:starch synthase
MPSRVEPCGLNQMYSLRYGTIPIVRSIGGLKDTVVDIDDDGFGICHQDVSVTDIVNAASRATTLYSNSAKLKKIKKEIMQIDHSWDVSAKAYLKLYNSIN